MWWGIAGRLVLAVVALVNLLPGIIAVMPSRVETVYGVRVDGPDLRLLLRHRAVVLATVGGLLMAAAVWPRLLAVACTVGGLSMASFVLFSWAGSGLNRQTRTVARIDVAALALLAAATFMMMSASAS